MIVGDTETTGLMRPEAIKLEMQPFLTEVYFMKVDDKSLEFICDYQTYVKPPVPIPEEITKYTGISNETVTDAPKFIEIYDDLAHFFLGEETCVGHNISFDLGVIWAELSRHGLEFKFPWPKNWICTVERSMSIEHRRIRLGALYEIATGHPPNQSHRAKDDAESTLVCYKYLREIGLI